MIGQEEEEEEKGEREGRGNNMEKHPTYLGRG